MCLCDACDAKESMLACCVRLACIALPICELFKQTYLWNRCSYEPGIDLRT